MQIRLGKEVPSELPSPERGRFAFLEAFPLSVLIFAAILGASYGLVGFAEWTGWKRTPINATYAGTVLVVAALFLSQLIDSAKQRFADDQAATGVLNNAFRLIAHGAKNEDVLKTLTYLAWSLYSFFRREDVQVFDAKGKEIKGGQAILAVLQHQIDAAELTAEMRLELLTQVREVVVALGGIARRRTYPILKSRYVVNALFSSVGVLLLSLAEATGETTYFVGQSVVFVFTYGLTTALIYVRHMEFGIGYDPGDVRPDLCLTGWLAEIEAAKSNSET